MTVLDAFAVIALLRDEPAASEVRQLVDSGGVQLTPIGVAEVLDRMIRRFGQDRDEVTLDLAQLGLLDPPPIRPDIAIRAGLLRAEHYRLRDREVSMADCFAAACASDADRVVATADPHLLDLCAAEEIAAVPLLDGRGRRWRRAV